MKIPCSVALLTLNAAEYLPACLESLKDFSEIIVCDGNSTDGTQDIARVAGARVIKQYDSDEPNLRCDMDKATVRQRVMDASTEPWRFFMDADDTLPHETVEEIRAIVQSSPRHLIWRMPSEVSLNGKIIRRYATYPAYQTRLVHVSVGARFKGEVHDHLVWDEKQFPAGTMKSHYTFHWPEERVKNFWKYQCAYINRELSVERWSDMTLGNFLYWWVYIRLRIIAAYLLWRLPALYLTYGFKDSMPLSLELQIVRYHFGLLFGGIKKFVSAGYIEKKGFKR
jgi:glycosyltransferase involved in cell wall biosynthesis